MAKKWEGGDLGRFTTKAVFNACFYKNHKQNPGEPGSDNLNVERRALVGLPLCPI